ncbi:hypothetical protein F5Y19DRAFT_73330 [Xylariaceae sp. FL1651]|nr:hypothetical protein F5Y19DRAFT_73330 [Xylariaceae sp. FL1651]
MLSRRPKLESIPQDYIESPTELTPTESEPGNELLTIRSERVVFSHDDWRASCPPTIHFHTESGTCTQDIAVVSACINRLEGQFQDAYYFFDRTAIPFLENTVPDEWLSDTIPPRRCRKLGVLKHVMPECAGALVHSIPSDSECQISSDVCLCAALEMRQILHAANFSLGAKTREGVITLSNKGKPMVGELLEKRFKADVQEKADFHIAGHEHPTSGSLVFAWVTTHNNHNLSNVNTRRSSGDVSKHLRVTLRLFGIVEGISSSGITKVNTLMQIKGVSDKLWECRGSFEAGMNIQQALSRIWSDHSASPGEEDYDDDFA